MKPTNFLFFVFFLFTSLSATGCLPLPSDLDSGHRPSRGSLSQGIETGNTRSRSSSGYSDHSDHHDNKPFYHPENQLVVLAGTLEVLDSLSSDEPRSAEAPLFREEYRSAKAPNALPDNARIGGGSFYSRAVDIGKQFKRMDRYGIQFQPRFGRSDISIKLSYTNYDFDDKWQYADNLNNPWSFDFGVDYKFYITKDSHFIQPYIGAGAAFGELNWSYRKSIVDQNTGEEFSDDSLDYVRFAGLIGLDIRISKVVRLGIDLQQDYTFFEITTNEGFTDDIFEDFGTITLGARLSLFF